MRLLLPAIALLTLAACSGGGSADTFTGPTQKAREVIISQSEMGEGNWLLTAKEAEFFQENEQHIVMHRPHLIFKAGGADDSSIRAHLGRYDMDEGLITLTGRIKGANKTQGITFETEKLYYDAETRLVWTDTPVTMIRGGVKVQGQGMKADSGFSEVEIFKQKTKLPPNIEELKAKSEVSL